MEDKQTRNLTILAGILVGMVAIITLVEAPEESAEEGEEQFEAGFPDVESAAISDLTMESPSGSLELKRQPEGWQIVAPGDWPAEGRRVDTLLDALLGVELTAPFESASPEDYGLNPPTVVVRATDAGGTVHALEIGEDAPVGGRTYVRVPSTGAIHATRTRLSQSVAMDPSELRSSELIRFSRPGITRIALSATADALRFDKDSDGWWLVSESPRRRADEARLGETLGALNELRADTFVEAPTAPWLPSLRVVLTEGQAEHVLELGPATGAPRMARGSLQDGDATVAPDFLAGMDLAPEQWLSTSLMPVHAITLDAIDAQIGTASMTAERTSSGWSAPAAESLLAAIGEVRVDRSRPAPEPAGEPWGRIGLREGEQRTTQIQLYQSVEGGRVARELPGGVPFVLSEIEIRRLQDALGTGG